MHYSSLSTPTHSVPFAEACMRGLAPDGELYLPESIPRFTRSKLRTLQKLDLADLGYEVLSAFITDIPGHDLRSIVSQALNFPIPINPVGTYEVLELSHGPTLSFKDVAARLLARFMAHYAQMAHLPVTVLVATSGDAGGAVASAFSDVPYTRVVVLFPKGRVSKMQYDQMTQVGDGVYPIEVNGSFDQCQSLVKQALVDPHHHHLHLTSANSINIGRLLPQIIYHAYASLQRKHLSLIHI